MTVALPISSRLGKSFRAAVDAAVLRSSRLTTGAHGASPGFGRPVQFTTLPARRWASPLSLGRTRTASLTPKSARRTRHSGRGCERALEPSPARRDGVACPLGGLGVFPTSTRRHQRPGDADVASLPRGRWRWGGVRKLGVRAAARVPMMGSPGPRPPPTGLGRFVDVRAHLALDDDLACIRRGRSLSINSPSPWRSRRLSAAKAEARRQASRSIRPIEGGARSEAAISSSRVIATRGESEVALYGSSSVAPPSVTSG